MFRSFLLLSLILWSNVIVQSTRKLQINIFGPNGVLRRRINFTNGDLKGITENGCSKEINAIDERLQNTEVNYASMADKIKALEIQLEQAKGVKVLQTRIVALEAKVHVLQAEAKSCVDDQTNLIKNLTHDLQQKILANKVRMMKTDELVASSVRVGTSTRSNIDRLSKRIDAADNWLTGQAIQIVDLDERVDRLVNESGASRHRPMIGFLAETTAQKSLNSLNRVKFDKVKFNNGNGYNGLSGEFIAPRSGIYVFHVTIFARNDEKVSFTLSVNGTSVVAIKRLSWPTVSASNSAIVNMAAGEVAVVLADKQQTIFDASTFLGYLLREE